VRPGSLVQPQRQRWVGFKVACLTHFSLRLRCEPTAKPGKTAGRACQPVPFISSTSPITSAPSSRGAFLGLTAAFRLGVSCPRGTLQPPHAVQQSANAGPVPFGTEWRWYLALVQLVRDSLDGQARLAKFMNCLAQGLGSQVRGPLKSQSIIAVTGLDQPKTYQHPGYGGAMPITAVGGWNPPSVQFIPQRLLGNEACSHKLSNGRRQSSGAGVRGLLERQRTVPPAPARRRLLTCSLHRAIMAGP
jgi:hypothetical protein